MHHFFLTAAIVLGVFSCFAVPILYMHHLDVKSTERLAEPRIIHKTVEKCHDLTPDFMKTPGQKIAEALVPLAGEILLGALKIMLDVPAKEKELAND